MMDKDTLFAASAGLIFLVNKSAGGQPVASGGLVFVVSKLAHREPMRKQQSIYSGFAKLLGLKPL